MFEVWTPPTMIWSMRYSLKKWAHDSHDSLNYVPCTCWQWNLPDQGLTCRNPAFFFHLRLPLSPQRNLKTWLLEFEVPESLSIFGKSSTHKLRTNRHQPREESSCLVHGVQWGLTITCSDWVRQKARKIKQLVHTNPSWKQEANLSYVIEFVISSSGYDTVESAEKNLARLILGKLR